MADMGRPLIPVPSEYAVDKRKYSNALKTFADQFYRMYEQKMEALVRKAGYIDGVGS
jgi:hypothetical protein